MWLSHRAKCFFHPLDKKTRAFSRYNCPRRREKEKESDNFGFQAPVTKRRPNSHKKVNKEKAETSETLARKKEKKKKKVVNFSSLSFSSPPSLFPSFFLPWRFGVGNLAPFGGSESLILCWVSPSSLFLSLSHHLLWGLRRGRGRGGTN